MATIDGLNIISCDELDSNVILYTGNLNGISPTVFNNISGSTSNLQTQINSIIGGGSSGSFSNLNVSNDCSLNRVNVKGKFSVNYINTISVPAFEVVCPSGSPANNYIGMYAPIYGSPIYNSGGFIFQDNNTTNQGGGGFIVRDYTGREYFKVNEYENSFLTTPEFLINGAFSVYSYNKTAYPTISLNKEIFQIYTDNSTGAQDAIYIDVPIASRTSGFTFVDNYSAIQGGGGLNLQDNAGRTYFYVNETVNSVLTTPLMNFNSSFCVNSYDRSNYPTLTFKQKVFEVFTSGSTVDTDQVNIYTPMVCSRDIKVNGLTIGRGGTYYQNGSFNTCFGFECLQNYINTTQNTACCAIGNSVLKNCVSGTSNTVVSNYHGMYDNITGSYNTAVGNRALEKSLNNCNTAVGDGAGGALVNGNNLTTTGYYSGRSIVSGVYNCSYGSYSYNASDFSYSCAFGAFTTIGGDYACAVGYGASANAHEVVLGTSTETVICPNILKVNGAISLNPPANGSTITFPSAIPTTASGTGGLGITWNDTGAGGGTGRTNFIGYGQGAGAGGGGFTFTSVSQGQAPITNVIINSNGLYISNGLNLNSSTPANNKINNLNTLNFDNTLIDKINFWNGGNSANSYIIGVSSGNFYYNAGNGSNNSHNFYVGGTGTTPLLTVAPNLTTIKGDVNATGALNCNSLSGKILNLNDYGTNNSFYTNIYQQNQYMTIRSFNNGTPVSTYPTGIFLQTMNASNVPINTLTLTTTDTSIIGTLGVYNILGGSFNAKFFQENQYLRIRSCNDGSPSTTTRSNISLQVMTSTQAVVEPMTLTSSEIQTIVPIQPNYNNLPSFTSYQIGGQVLGTFINPTFTSGQSKAIFSLALPMGVWIVNATIALGATAFSSYRSIISSAINQVVFVDTKSNSGLDGINSSGLLFNMNATIQVTTTTTYYVNITANFSGSFLVNNTSTSCFMGTRIA